MSAGSRFSYLKTLAVGALMLLGAAALPATAEAQARGTLQASATVVDTRQGFGALDAARSAVRSAQSPTDFRLDSRIGSRETVATVAQVSVERPATRPSALVVTIDYSRN
jgi:hypothetical protein